MVKHVQIDLETKPNSSKRDPEKDLNAERSLMESAQGGCNDEQDKRKEMEAQISQILHESHSADHTFSIDIHTRIEDSHSGLLLTPHLAEFVTESKGNSPPTKSMVAERHIKEKLKITDLIPEFRDCEDIFNQR